MRTPLIEEPIQPIDYNPKCRFRFIEPLPVIYIASCAILEPVLQQYVYLRIAEDFGIKKLNTSQTEELSQLCDANKSSPTFKIQQATQSATSQFLMCLALVQVLLCCPTILLLGSIINRIGRKVAIYMTFSSRLIYAVTIACVIRFELPIHVLFVGSAIDGLCGSIEAAMMSFNTYIADVTSPGKQRSFRMTVLEGVIGLTSGTASLVTGFLIRHINFLTPVYVVLCLLTLGLIYVVFFLMDSYRPTENKDDTKSKSLNVLRATFKHYIWDTSEKRRSRLLLALMGGFFTAPALTASIDVIVLYVLNSPFCWTSDHIGNFLAAQTYSRWLFALTMVKLLQRCLSDIDIAILGNCSCILAVIILAFAQNDTTIYLCTFSYYYFTSSFPPFPSSSPSSYTSSSFFAFSSSFFFFYYHYFFSTFFSPPHSSSFAPLLLGPSIFFSSFFYSFFLFSSFSPSFFTFAFFIEVYILSLSLFQYRIMMNFKLKDRFCIMNKNILDFERI